ncbi:MAG: c(7)-type cytochrome triheme domain-containing protein [Deltaproteobacteria bacterium]
MVSAFRKNCLLIFLMALLAMPFIVEAPRADEKDDREMEPAPVDRPGHRYLREPGQFKRTLFGFIDPTPDVTSLQFLPKDSYGFVDWVKAISEGLISPKGSLDKDAMVEEALPPGASDNVLIKSKFEFMPDVMFPHSRHTVWLKCGVCHPKIFASKAGETPELSMTGIWKGRFCGRCHDKVAFPIRNCFKCHSVPRQVKTEAAP